MKLREITSSKEIFIEGFVEPNVMMSVQNIINRGYANNTFEYITICRLLQLIKIGEFYKTSNPMFDSNLSTSKELLDYLKSIPSDDFLEISKKIMTFLQIKNEDLLAKYSNPEQEFIEWIKLYTVHEANE